MQYPGKLHGLQNDYPLCPERIEVGYDMLSKHCRDTADKYGLKAAGVKKLIPNLGDTIEYVIHYENLLYYLSLGMKLTKIHRILSFKQSNWLKSYVDFNTQKRKESTNEADKDFFKLIVICIYGKSCESVRKRCNI